MEITDLSFKYDIERLKCYNKLQVNQGKIHIQQHSNYLLLSYSEVAYFNYILCFDDFKIENVIAEAKIFFDQHNIPRHRLLLEETSNYDYAALLKENGYVLENKQVLLQKQSVDQSFDIKPGVVLEPVSLKTLSSFTQDYLFGFESEQKNITHVVDNFSQLLDCDDINLFRVIDNGNPVAVAVLYKSSQDFLFAGGAVLPGFRNNGYHKDALFLRMQKCKEQHAKQVTAWAYENSDSYKNMVSIGFTPYKTYLVYGK